LLAIGDLSSLALENLGDYFLDIFKDVHVCKRILVSDNIIQDMLCVADESLVRKK
jgi:hypothetical protein